MQRPANDETINNQQYKCNNLQIDIQYYLKTIRDLTQNISEYNNYIKELKEEMKDAERQSVDVRQNNMSQKRRSGIGKVLSIFTCVK